MTQVDFYTNSNDKLRTCCQLCHKIIQNQLRALILLPNNHMLQTLNNLLWEYPATSFLPHCEISAPNAASTPILLSLSSHVPYPCSVLINLSNHCPDNIEGFERVLEIICNEEQDSQAGRERYKHYRTQGLSLRHFDLSNSNE